MDHKDVLLRKPPQRPSNVAATQLDRGLPGETALTRFNQERDVLTAQLQECTALQATLLETRRRRNKLGLSALQAHTELAQGEGFFVKTEIPDTDSFIVSLGLQDAYVELELEEAIAYAQRREQYTRV